MGALTARLLQPGDHAVIDAFLSDPGRADTSMFLRSNLREVGVVDGSARYQARWIGADDNGRLVGVMAHSWSGMIQLQADPPAIPALFAAWREHATRPLHGMVGPAAQVLAAQRHLGLQDRPLRLNSLEVLFGLSLDELQLPPALQNGHATVRRGTPDDVDLLSGWYQQYERSLISGEPEPGITERCRERSINQVAERRQFILEAGGQPVAISTFNARLPDCVQVGGVWTPPALRGNGYARAVVAGSLQLARAEGATRSILFTGSINTPAIRAYVALGYREIGDYYLLGFVQPVPVDEMPTR